jgi:type IV secretory pathway VirB2 component (pilin)
MIWVVAILGLIETALMSIAIFRQQWNEATFWLLLIFFLMFASSRVTP